MKIWIAGENLYFKMSMTYTTVDMLKIKIYLIVQKVKAKKLSNCVCSVRHRLFMT